MTKKEVKREIDKQIARADKHPYHKVRDKEKQKWSELKLLDMMRLTS